MFSNIGGKIKGLATFLTIFGFVVFGGIALITLLASFAGGEEAIVVGLIASFFIAVIGCLASWLGSFLLYGFGELIENSKKIADSCTLGSQPKMPQAQPYGYQNMSPSYQSQQMPQASQMTPMPHMSQMPSMSQAPQMAPMPQAPQMAPMSQASYVEQPAANTEGLVE